MMRAIVVFGASLIGIAAATSSQQKSERARVMIAALEEVKARQGGSSRPFLLSSHFSGRVGQPIDSALLAEISSVALRVTAPIPPVVLDTFVLSVELPERMPDGTYNIRAGGYLARNTPGRGCTIGGPSNTYTVTCTASECKAAVARQVSGSGRCD
jgi:hypothetical protein